MKPFIVAEMSANHNGSQERAMQIIEMAAWAGADAIKFQMWQPGSMCLDHSYTIERGAWKGYNLAKLYEQAYTPLEWFPEMFQEAKRKGIIAFATPFDVKSVDMLEKLDCPMYKISSFELVDHRLIADVASTKKPLVLSTGMATIAEIQEAFETARIHTEQVTLLKCTSAYPTLYESVNLTAMTRLKAMFHAPVGISDHTMGSAIPVAATALGAEMIEKHLTLMRSDGGLDHVFSMQPTEFKSMVEDVHATSEAMGTGNLSPSPEELTELRRSLFFTRDMKKGEIVAPEDIASSRPATGAKLSLKRDIIGTELIEDVRRGQPVEVYFFER